MKKAGNGFVKNLHYFCLAGVIALGLMTIIATGAGDGGDKSTTEGSKWDSMVWDRDEWG